MFKRIFLAATIAVALTFPLTVKAAQFTDMPVDWSKTALENAVSNGLLFGDGDKIMPESNLTRAQMAAIINRAFGAIEKGDISKFKDISQDKWYVDDLAKAYKMGTLVGNENNEMSPEEFITREQAYSVLVRAFCFVATNKNALDGYTDKDDVSKWAVNSVIALAQDGYLKNLPDGEKIKPQQKITRAEFAVVMDNLAKQYINAEGTYNESVDGSLLINKPGVVLKNVAVNGNLIIADGVGRGEVTLDGVKITGTAVIRGGGENSIIISGSSTIPNLSVYTTSGIVAIKVTGNALVEVVYVNDGSDEVIVNGNVSNLSVGQDVTVNTVGANIKNLKVEGSGSTVVIDKASSIDNVSVNLTAAQANIQVNGTAKTVNTEGLRTTVTIGGTVDKLDVAAGATGTAVTVQNGAKVNNITAETKLAIINNGTVTYVESRGEVTVIEGNNPTNTPPTTTTPSTGASNTGSSNTPYQPPINISGGSDSGSSDSGTTTPVQTPAPVLQPYVTDISIIETGMQSIQIGTSSAVRAIVNAYNGASSGVVWRIDGYYDNTCTLPLSLKPGTAIDFQTGVLSIDPNETINAGIKVTATSVYDSSKTASIAVKVTKTKPYTVNFEQYAGFIINPANPPAAINKSKSIMAEDGEVVIVFIDQMPTDKKVYPENIVREKVGDAGVRDTDFLVFDVSSTTLTNGAKIEGRQLYAFKMKAYDITLKLNPVDERAPSSFAIAGETKVAKGTNTRIYLGDKYTYSGYTAFARSDKVTWNITGYNDNSFITPAALNASTVISPTGVLSVAANETVKYIVVIGTSTLNGQTAAYTVEVTDELPYALVVSPTGLNGTFYYISLNSGNTEGNSVVVNIIGTPAQSISAQNVWVEKFGDPSVKINGTLTAVSGGYVFTFVMPNYDARIVINGN